MSYTHFKVGFDPLGVDVRSYDLHMVFYTHSDKEDAYFVELYTQPWYRKLIANVYHWYDMRIFKVPGFNVLEAIKEWLYRNKDPMDYLPISAEQDMRCYYFKEKRRVVVAKFEITKEQYEELRLKP